MRRQLLKQPHHFNLLIMPIPKPRKGEKQSDFIARCMGDSTMGKDYPKTGQRYAICIDSWSTKKEDGYKPTEEMARQAKQGLEWRDEFNRGGTEVGVARARDIMNRKNLSLETVNRMVSYFARHEVDKKAEGFNKGENGFPSAGRIAWQLWGGDPGKSWADNIANMKKATDEFIQNLKDESNTED